MYFAHRNLLSDSHATFPLLSLSRQTARPFYFLLAFRIDKRFSSIPPTRQSKYATVYVCGVRGRENKRPFSHFVQRRNPSTSPFISASNNNLLQPALFYRLRYNACMRVAPAACFFRLQQWSQADWLAGPCEYITACTVKHV